MQINEYQKQAHTFADYSKPICKGLSFSNSAEYTYPALGLAEEAGEVAGKFAKAVRDESGFFYDLRFGRFLSDSFVKYHCSLLLILIL